MTGIVFAFQPVSEAGSATPANGYAGSFCSNSLPWMWWTLKVWMSRRCYKKGPKGSGRTGRSTTTSRNEMDGCVTFSELRLNGRETQLRKSDLVVLVDNNF